MPRAPSLCKKIMEVTTIKFYTDKPTWYAYPEENERTALRDKHATISVIKHRMGKLSAVDDYLCDCEKRFKVEFLKRLNGSVLSAWENTMNELNAQLFPRGKNTILECLRFGGNKEFWDVFESEAAIRQYFAECYAYAENKIGFLKTDENIICAAIITEKVRRNLFVWYLPVTEMWHSKVMSTDKSERGNRLQLRDEFDEPLYRYHCEIDAPRLSSTEFWKKRGGLTSFSDLQEDFYNKISSRYGAERGESKSLIKNTNDAQAHRFNREQGDRYDELPPYDDLPY